METKIKKFEGPPETFPEPSPKITPEMVKTVFHLLEKKGMVQYFEGGIYIPTEKGWKLLMSTATWKEEIEAYGHPKITATDNLVIKITKKEEIDEGTIGVKANKACVDFSKELKNALKSNKTIVMTLEAEGISDSVVAYCSPALEVSSTTEIVIRKDDTITPSTIGIMSDKSANDLKRDLIEKLKNPNTRLKIILEVRP
jgi:hypothetical protein